MLVVWSAALIWASYVGNTNQYGHAAPRGRCSAGVLECLGSSITFVTFANTAQALIISLVISGRRPKGGDNMGCLEQMVSNLGDGNSPAPDSISNEQNSPSYHAVLRIEQQIG
jgi:hypothetical protein